MMSVAQLAKPELRSWLLGSVGGRDHICRKLQILVVVDIWHCLPFHRALDDPTDYVIWSPWLLH
jgi:hypothetical protein